MSHDNVIDKLMTEYEDGLVILASIDIATGNIEGVTTEDFRAMDDEQFEAAMRKVLAPTPAPTPVTVASLTRDAVYQSEKWGAERRMKLYNEMSAQDKRIANASKWVSSLESKGYTKAQSQLMAMVLLKEIHREGAFKAWMGNFAEKMLEELIGKMSAFGCDKAHPLTDNQFNAAIKAAW